MRTHRFAQSLIRAVAYGLMTLVLFLTASDRASAQVLTPSQRAALSNLYGASGTIKEQVALGLRYSGTLGVAATEGTIVDPAAHRRALITEQQRTDYNQSLGTYRGTDFYTSSQFFQQKGDEARASMRTAISDLAAAAVDLQKAAVLNQQLQGAADAPTAKAVQGAILSSGLGAEISSRQMDAYNQSLANVNSYATQAAAFMRAADSKVITQNLDAFKAQYSLNITYATATFDYATGTVGASWEGFSLGQSGALDQFKMSSDAFHYTSTNAMGLNNGR